MRRLFRSLVAVGALAGLAACGDDVSITQPPAPDVIITGAPTAALKVGESVQLSANQAVTWSTSNASVASVSADGLVSAAGAGNASITASSTADATKKASVAISVTASQGVSGISLSQTAAILAPAQTLQLTANVTRDAGVSGAVTWTSSNTAVATVDAGGVITAVTPGTASITATSVADPSYSASLALTVRAPTPATVTIASVTALGTFFPVNYQNVAGQIDVTVNVDPGDFTLSGVDLLIDGQVVQSQEFTAAQSEMLRLAAVSEEIAADVQQIVFSINTANFDATTGAVIWTNGNHTLGARVRATAGGAPSSTATPGISFTLNNQSGVVVTISNTNGNDPASAINPATGIQWIGGSVTLSFVGVSYIQGITVASVNYSVFGKTRTTALTANAGTQSFSEGTGWSGTNTGVGGYASPAVGETVTGASAVLSNGQNLVTTLPSIILNFGSPAQGNANIPVLPTIRLDNTAPGATSANGIVPAGAIAIGAMPIWVNASTAFGAGTVGLQSSGTLNSATTPRDVGVDNMTVTVFAGPSGALTGYNPGGVAGSCSIPASYAAVTVGSDLAETLVSGTYQGRVHFIDAVGNIGCYDLSPIDPLAVANGSFGADFQAPTGTVTGPADGSAAAAVGATWAYAVADNASGFGPTPVSGIMRRVNANGSTSCVLGSGSGCSTQGTAALGFDGYNGSATDGYYTFDPHTVLDQAGNALVFATRTYLLDQVPAAFSGGMSLQPLYTGNAPAIFTTAVTDNMDLNNVFGTLAYPLGTLQYPTQAIGSYGVPLEQAATVNFTVANFIRCLNLNGDQASTNTQPTSVDLFLSDFAQAAPTAFGGFAIPVTNVQACDGVSTITINSFAQSAPNYGAGKTQVDINGASLAGASSATVTLSVVADVPLNTSNDPFSRVDFYYTNAAGNWVQVGTALGLLSQTPANRTYTYTFVWDPDAAVQSPANVNVVAIGVDGNGDAMFSTVQAVVTVP